MALSFPTFPADGDIFVQGQVAFIYYASIDAWVAAGAGAHSLPVGTAVGQTVFWNGTTWDAGTAVARNVLAATAGSPTTRDDGTTLVQGDIYVNTGTDRIMTWTGAAWLDTGSGIVSGTAAGQVLVWDGGVWRSGNPGVYSGATAPTVPTPMSGTQWFNSVTKTLYTYDGADWIDAGSTTANGNTASRPTSPSTGDQYYNTQTATLEIYSGAAWAAVDESSVDVRYQVAAFAPTTRADTTALVEGDQYYNTTLDKTYVWSGSGWADRTIDPRYQVSATAPSSRVDSTALEEGDKYYNTTQNTTYTWSGTAWVADGGGGSSTVDARYQVSATAPSSRADSTALEEGDKYFNTTSDRTFTWSGTAWATLDRQFDWQTNTTSVQPILRSDGISALVTGDMYFDSVENTLYSWNGITWISAVVRKKSYFFASF